LAAQRDIVSLLKPTALYTLAAQSTPESVQTAVVEKLRNGEKVGLPEIKRMLKEKRLSDDKRGESKLPIGRREKRTTTKDQQSTKTDGADHSPSVRVQPRKAQMFRMKPEVGKKVMKRLPPADQQYFWARIRHMDDHLMIVKLAKRRPTK
jgi:hypothetical protein